MLTNDERLELIKFLEWIIEEVNSGRDMGNALVGVTVPEKRVLH